MLSPNTDSLARLHIRRQLDSLLNFGWKLLLSDYLLWLLLSDDLLWHLLSDHLGRLLSHHLLPNNLWRLDRGGNLPLHLCRLIWYRYPDSSWLDHT